MPASLDQMLNKTGIKMKTRLKVLVAAGTAGFLFFLTPGFKTANNNPLDHKHVEICGSKGCTFKTLFGEESSEGYGTVKNLESVKKSLSSGLDYLVQAQQKDGGWGAGSHSFQHIRDPHVVSDLHVILVNS